MMENAELERSEYVRLKFQWETRKTRGKHLKQLLQS